jgi:uncharacterized protein GlcG (DUF336 family)
MNTITKNEISIEACLSMFSAAKMKSQEIGLNVAMTIVDLGGNIKFFARMDGAPLMAVDISRKKAVTAIGFGMPTGASWHDFIKDDPILDKGVGNIADFMLLGGGKPIVINGEIVGAIGISGGHYAQDEACCDAALASL